MVKVYKSLLLLTDRRLSELNEKRTKVKKLDPAFILLKAVDRMERARKIIRDICSKCTTPSMTGLDDPCWLCPWRWVMNQILGNEK